MKITYEIELDEEYDIDMLNNFLNEEIEMTKRNEDCIHIRSYNYNYSFKDMRVIK